MNDEPHHFRFMAGLACTGLLLPALVVAAISLDGVLHSASVAPPSRVCFVEERHNALLREPLVISGYLEYLGDGKLSKVVQSPFVESFLLDGNIIEISRDGETRRIAPGQGRAMVAMLNGIEALLVGDTSVLQKVFDTQVTGTEDAWVLVLRPESRRMQNHLDRITVTGNSEAIANIQFELENGERHLMRLGSRDIEDCVVSSDERNKNDD